MESSTISPQIKRYVFAAYFQTAFTLLNSKITEERDEKDMIHSLTNMRDSSTGSQMQAWPEAMGQRSKWTNMRLKDDAKIVATVRRDL